MTTKTITSIGLALILTAFLSVSAYARGSCDGYHGCRCGVTAASYNGVSLTYKGFNLKRAVEWVRAFPRTSFQSGTVGYVPHGGPSGHVFTVVDGANCSTATVHDDKGTYQRNVCHATFVAVHGGERVQTARVEPRHHRLRMQRNVQIASYVATDRHSVH